MKQDRWTSINRAMFYLNRRINVWDVSGQLNISKSHDRWIYLFNEMTVIIFVVSLSCYDQVCIDDPSRNMMHQALELFEYFYHFKYFAGAPVFLLYFNK